jgi:TusA-related sulfurtransferase
MNSTIPQIKLDVRGLAAPEPMVRILEATATLQPGGVLTVTHNRVPTLIYPRLAERGLSVDTVEAEDGVVVLTIKRPTNAG